MRQKIINALRVGSKMDLEIIDLRFFFGFLGLMCFTSATASLHPFYEEVTADEWHCGYKGDKDKIVIPIRKYEYCGDFFDGLAYVGKKKLLVTEDYEGYQHFQGFINEKGELVIPIEHEVSDSGDQEGYRSFSEGLVAVYRNNKLGYMNKNRELVVPYRYQYASDFKDGLAIVSENGKVGAINHQGNTIIPFKFDYLSDYSEGLAVYSEKNHWNDDFQYGFIDKKGNISLKAKWDSANNFSEGLAAVRVSDGEDGKWGIIDRNGNFIVPPKYDEAAINTQSDEYLDGGVYKAGKINMYNYTDNSKPYESSIIRYTLDRQGKVINKKYYPNWDSVIEDYLESDNF